MSSSPLRGVATCLPTRLCFRGCGSSSPPRGVATRTRSEGSAPWGQVLIVPTRGRNRRGREPPQKQSRVLIALTRGRNRPTSWIWPRRPSLVLIISTRGCNRSPSTLADILVSVLIALTRGSQRHQHGDLIGRHPGPHRPCEGSQPDHVLGKARVDLSSSPLRGVETGQRKNRTRRHMVFIAPTEVAIAGRRSVPSAPASFSSSLQGAATQKSSGLKDRLWLVPGSSMQVRRHGRSILNGSERPCIASRSATSLPGGLGLRNEVLDRRSPPTTYEDQPLSGDRQGRTTPLGSSSVTPAVADGIMVITRICSRPSGFSALPEVHCKSGRIAPRKERLNCGFTLGSSSPLRGVATRHRSREQERAGVLIALTRGRNCSGALRTVRQDRVLIALTRGRNWKTRRWCSWARNCPHRPYEGSQRFLRDVLAGGVGGPHRPYEGSQLEPCLVSPVVGCPHRPYEGSQRDLPPPVDPGRPGPHRPYEGSQHRAGGAVHDADGVLIAPTRGRNSGSVSVVSGIGVRPHRLYKGSQLGKLVVGPGFSLGSLSPLRGVVTDRGSRRQGWCPGPHRPYEGSQLAQGERVAALAPGPHRPYEGSQHDEQGQLAAAHESSSPLRGVATRRGRRRSGSRGGVLIALTRGRNGTSGSIG